MQWDHPWIRKLGLLFFWSASGTGIAFVTGHWWMGVAAMVIWILFPISEIIFVLRRLQVPRMRVLKEALPPIDEFPGLRDLSTEMESLGFIKVDECDLTPSVHEQYYRLFAHPTEPIHASIGFISHDGIGFHFIEFSSEEKSGRLWVTWDYPLTYGLKTPPQVALHRALHCQTLADLYHEHLAFLEINGVQKADLVQVTDAAGVRARLEKTLEQQLEYNVKLGILAPEPTSDRIFRYSWRGTFYVTFQVIRDLVRL